MSNLHELKQAVVSTFKICMTYKSPKVLHWVAYTSEIEMELFIISVQGMCLKVVIWLMERQDSLRNMGMTTAGIPHIATSPAGDVLENREREEKLVRRPSPHLGVGRRATTEQ